MKGIFLTSLWGVALAAISTTPVAQAEAGVIYPDGSYGDYGESLLINTLFTLKRFYEREEINEGDPLCAAGKSREELRAQAMRLILENKGDCVNQIHYECGHEFPAIQFAIDAGELELVRLMIAQGCKLGDTRVALAPKDQKGRALECLKLYLKKSKEAQ